MHQLCCYCVPLEFPTTTVKLLLRFASNVWAGELSYINLREIIHFHSNSWCHHCLRKSWPFPNMSMYQLHINNKKSECDAEKHLRYPNYRRYHMNAISHCSMRYLCYFPFSLQYAVGNFVGICFKQHFDTRYFVFYNPSPPKMFFPWSFFQNIGFNMVPSDPFMSHLATQLGYKPLTLANWINTF